MYVQYVVMFRLFEGDSFPAELFRLSVCKACSQHKNFDKLFFLKIDLFQGDWQGMGSILIKEHVVGMELAKGVSEDILEDLRVLTLMVNAQWHY